MKNIQYDFEAPSTSHLRDYVFGKLPSDTIFNLDELKNIVNDVMAKIPNEILKSMEDDGWKIIVTNKRKLEQEYNFDIKIYGLTDFSKKEILTYATPSAIRYSIPHEVGHYVDSLFDYISQSKEWDSVFQLEKSDASKIGNNYFVLYNTPEEFFGECFGAYLLMSEEEKKGLKRARLLQKSMDCICRLIKVLPYVEKKEKTLLEKHMDGTMKCETKFW